MPTASWLHTIVTDEAMVVVPQPQAIVWKRYRSLDVRTAVAVTKKGTQRPVLGTLEASVDADADFDTHEVVFSNRRLRSSRFPSLNTEQAAAMGLLVQRVMARQPSERVPLDVILSSLKEKGSETKGVELKNDPPVIFYSPKPANRIAFDGDSVMNPVFGMSLQFRP